MPASLGILAIGVIGAVLLFFMAWRSPTLASTVWVIAVTVFSEYILLPDAPTLHVHLSRVWLTALLLGLVAGWVPWRKRPTASAHPERLILILTVWTIISACWTGTMFRADGTRNLSVFLTGFFVPAVILYVARTFPLPLKALRTVCILLTVLLGYMIFTAFCEHFNITSLVFPQYILNPSLGIHTERARGPVVNAAENGGIIAVLLLIGLHTVLYTSRGIMRWVSSLGLLSIGAAALWFTETRGTWLAFAGGLLVMMLHKRSRAFLLPIGGAGVLVLGAFLVYSGVSVDNLVKKDPMPQREDNTSDTVDFRMDLYRESIRPFQAHPFVGWGLGTFTDEDHLFDAYSPSLTISTAVLHDTVDAITLESGIIGGILYLSFLVTITAALLRLRRASLNCEKRDFYTLCLASLAAFVINGSFVDIRYFMPQNALVFLMIGLGLSIPPNDRPQLGSYTAEPAPSQEIEPWSFPGKLA